jgi:hypothetical protein
MVRKATPGAIVFILSLALFFGQWWAQEVKLITPENAHWLLYMAIFLFLVSIGLTMYFFWPWINKPFTKTENAERVLNSSVPNLFIRIREVYGVACATSNDPEKAILSEFGTLGLGGWLCVIPNILITNKSAVPMSLGFTVHMALKENDLQRSSYSASTHNKPVSYIEKWQHLKPHGQHLSCPIDISAYSSKTGYLVFLIDGWTVERMGNNFADIWNQRDSELEIIDYVTEQKLKIPLRNGTYSAKPSVAH